MPGLFEVGRPVAGKQLVGREEIISQILFSLKSGQSVVLIAPRRYGKTSVMMEVISRLHQDKCFTSSVDVFATPSLEVLSEQIMESVLSNRGLERAFAEFRKNLSGFLKQLEFKQTVEEFEFILGFQEKSIDEKKLFSNSLDFIDQFADKHKKQIVCAFDEFGDIEKLDGKEIVKLFRSKIQMQKNTSYLFSGSYESVMNKIFVTSKSPLYRFARLFHLSEIDTGLFAVYIQNAFKSLDVDISSDALDLLLEFTRGHPYYTQLICKQLEYFCSVNHINRLQSGHIQKSIEESYWAEISYIEQLWSEISASKEQVRVLVSLVKNQKPLYGSNDLKRVNVSRALRNLTARGIIRKEDGNYIVQDPMLRLFIHAAVLKQDFKQLFLKNME